MTEHEAEAHLELQGKKLRGFEELFSPSKPRGILEETLFS